jgi:hypothetical protein
LSAKGNKSPEYKKATEEVKLLKKKGALLKTLVNKAKKDAKDSVRNE